jgi:hypothetical protein
MGKGGRELEEADEEDVEVEVEVVKMVLVEVEGEVEARWPICGEQRGLLVVSRVAVVGMVLVAVAVVRGCARASRKHRWACKTSVHVRRGSDAVGG